MSGTVNLGWRDIHAEVFRRISEREWKPGEQIPKESDLALEFKCARATVNRALRQLATEGLLDRRRKGGTRVALNPVRKATLDISITRLEVEARGGVYSHKILECREALISKAIAAKMSEGADSPMLHVRTLHMSDGVPFMYEDRWINSGLIPESLSHDFTEMNANEWLIQNALYTSGDITFLAANATDKEAKILNIEPGRAIFIIERITWNGDAPVTFVKLDYAPGFQMETTL